MAYHPLVVEVISNYPSVQFVLNQTSGKHVCLPQHPAGQDQTIWKLKAMARNPLVSTKGVTTAKEGVLYFAGTPILFCKRYKTSLLHVCCYVHGGLLSAKCHPFLRKFAQSEVSIAILPNGMDEAFPRFRPQLWFWKTSPLFLIDSTHLCRCHGALSFRHLLKYVEILYAGYWLHGGMMIYHVKRKFIIWVEITCDLGQYFDCFLDSLHFLQVHLGQKDPKVSWRGFQVLRHRDSGLHFLPWCL